MPDFKNLQLRKDLLFTIPAKEDAYFDFEVDHDNVLVIAINTSGNQTKLHTTADCKRLAVASWQPENGDWGYYCIFLRGRNKKLYMYNAIWKGKDLWPNGFNTYTDPFLGSIVAANCAKDKIAVFGLNQEGELIRLRVSKTGDKRPIVVDDRYPAFANKKIVALAATSMSEGSHTVFALLDTGELFVNTDNFDAANPVSLGERIMNGIYLNDIVAASCGQGYAAVFGVLKLYETKANGNVHTIHKICKIYTEDNGGNWYKKLYSLTYGADYRNFAEDLKGALGVICTNPKVADENMRSGTYELFGMVQDGSVRRFLEKVNHWTYLPKYKSIYEAKLNDEWISPDPTIEDGGLCGNYLDFKTYIDSGPFTNLVVGSYKKLDNRGGGAYRPYFDIFTLSKKGEIVVFHQEGYRKGDGNFLRAFYEKYEKLGDLIKEKGGLAEPKVSHKLVAGDYYYFTILKPAVVKVEGATTHLDFGPFTGEAGRNAKDHLGYHREASCLELTYIKSDSQIKKGPPKNTEIIKFPVNHSKFNSFLYEIKPNEYPNIKLTPKLVQEQTLIHVFDQNWHLKTTLSHLDQLKGNSEVLQIGEGLKLIAFVKPKLVFEIGDPEEDAKIYVSDMD